MFLVSFFSREQIWFFQVFWSNNTPKNLIAFVLSIALLAIFNSGSIRGILSLIEFLLKSLYLFFLIFNDSLFALNHYPILWNSLFKIKKNVEIFRWEKKRLVSSANIMGSKIFEALQGHLHILTTIKVQVLILG